MQDWQLEWPTEDGFYWFYGWRFLVFKTDGKLPELSYVQVITDNEKITWYLCNGHYMKNSIGVWMEVNIPKLPKDLDKLISELEIEWEKKENELYKINA